MEALLKKFFNFLEIDKKLANNTLLSYKRDLQQFQQYIIKKGVQYNRVKEEDMIEYIEDLSNQGKKSSSISRNLAAVRAFYQYGMRIGKIKKNPTQKVKAPKVEKRTPSVLTSQEVELFLDQPKAEDLKGTRDKAMLEFAYATGMKATEIISLNMDDIDINNSFVRCNTSSKTREIPLGKLAIDAAKDYLEKAREILIKDPNEKALFVNTNGTRLTRQGFWKIIKYYKEQANITKEITPHVLRHSFATHLLQNGADIKSIQTMLGHNDISSTQVYMQFQNTGIKDIYQKAHPRA